MYQQNGSVSQQESQHQQLQLQQQQQLVRLARVRSGRWRCPKHQSKLVTLDKSTQTFICDTGQDHIINDKNFGHSIKHFLSCTEGSKRSDKKEPLLQEKKNGSQPQPKNLSLYTEFLLNDENDSRSGLYHANFADVQMDELNLEKAYSIEYYKRMFYPEEGMWVS